MFFVHFIPYILCNELLNYSSIQCPSLVAPSACVQNNMLKIFSLHFLTVLISGGDGEERTHYPVGAGEVGSHQTTVRSPSS